MLARLMLVAAIGSLMIAGCRSSTTEPDTGGGGEENKSTSTAPAGGETARETAAAEPAGTEPAATEAAVSPEVSFEELTAAFTQERDAILAKAREPAADRRALQREFSQLPEQFAPKALELAEANPDNPVAVKALAWVMNSAPGSNFANSAFELIKQKYADSPDIGPIFQALTMMRQPPEGVQEFVNSVIDSNPSRDAKGAATYYLGMMAQQKEDTEEAIKFLSKVESDFGDVAWMNHTLGDQVAPVLFELQHLQVGCEAPDIVGEDVDGIEFKLSDYRGKVVMLDFWGNW